MRMNRVVALGIVGWIAFAALGGCQGADPFDRSGGGGGAIGGGGKIVTGNGGKIVTGNGGSGAGGHGSGGIGAGGTNTGGRGMGGTAAGGSAAGGAGGLGAGGSNMGGRGMGGTGAGGRIVDAGANCISTVVAAGYSAGTAPACSACKDQNSNSYEMKCTMMIDCMASKPQPCGGNCELDCFNTVGGNGPLRGCVDAILTAGGCE